MSRRLLSPQALSVYRASESAAPEHGQLGQLHEWLQDAPLAEPKLLAAIQDHAADVWQALIAVADGAGRESSTRERVAAVALVAHAETTKPSPNAQLVVDLGTVSGTALALPTATIRRALCAMEASIWGGELDTRPLDHSTQDGWLVC